MHNFLLNYKSIDGLFTPCLNDSHLKSFDYSDGELFEQEIKSIIEQTADRSVFSLELRKQIKDWRAGCHLSPVRANLLRPLAFLCKKNTLELGSGCGAITRYLGELGGDVVALEASRLRAQITRARTQDLNNVAVVWDRIEDFTCEKQFDAVTLIGVLQYARLFSNFTQHAEGELLKNAARHLKEDGSLIIAIQNKLGLKYFSGYPEANVDQPFFGIENQYGNDTIVRFSRYEIQQLLASIGLKYCKFLIPLPDYHMPVSLLNFEKSKHCRDFSYENFLTTAVSRDRLRPDWTPPFFSLEKAWPAIQSAQLSEELANSFLIIATKTEQGLSLIETGLQSLAWHYSVERHPSYATEKRFMINENTISTQRSRLHPQATPPVPVVHHVEKEDYVEGQLWWCKLVDILNHTGWTSAQLADWLTPWLTTLFAHENKESTTVWQLDADVSGRLFDLTPLNCIQKTAGTLQFIDQEWELQNPLKFSHLLIRGLFGSLSAMTCCAEPAEGQSIRILDLIQETLQKIGFNLQAHHIEHFIVEEHKIQQWINQGEENTSDCALWRHHVQTISLCYKLPIPKESFQQLTQKHSQLKNEMLHLQQAFATLQQETQSIKKNTLWLFLNLARRGKRTLLKYLKFGPT